MIQLDGSVEERASLDVDRKAGVVRIKLGDREGQRVPWGHLPFHVYNFDFTSLNFAWRHLADPKAPFEIGVMDPTFRAEGEPFLYRGVAKIEYVGEEKLHGKRCRKYRISGPGIGGSTGAIWAPRKGDWLEKIEIPFPDNPDWNSFKLELESTEHDDAGRLEEIHRRLAREGEREELTGSAGDKLLLFSDRLRADRGELGILADGVEERVGVHRRMAEVVGLDGLAEEAQRSLTIAAEGEKTREIVLVLGIAVGDRLRLDACGGAVPIGGRTGPEDQRSGFRKVEKTIRRLFDLAFSQEDVGFSPLAQPEPASSRR